MKCPHCGAELPPSEGVVRCAYCSSYFTHSPRADKGAFFISGGSLLSYSGNEGDLLIPDGVIRIGEACFKGNLALKRVTFPDSLREIGEEAFCGCSSLRSIRNYEKVTAYGASSFEGAGLTLVEIGPNVVSLGESCFQGMPYLEKVIYRPGKALKLRNAFARCPNLEEVEMDQQYFYPTLLDSSAVKMKGERRPSLGDAFRGSPVLKKTVEAYLASIRKGICPQCGGKLRKGIFHIVCSSCGADYKS